MSRKVKTKISHVEAHDEVGNLVFFEMPFAAMYYDTEFVSVDEEEKVHAKQEKLATEYCALADKRQSAFKGLTGKIKYVNRLLDKGVWV